MTSEFGDYYDHLSDTSALVGLCVIKEDPMYKLLQMGLFLSVDCFEALHNSDVVEGNPFCISISINCAHRLSAAGNEKRSVFPSHRIVGQGSVTVPVVD